MSIKLKEYKNNITKFSDLYAYLQDFRFMLEEYKDNFTKCDNLRNTLNIYHPDKTYVVKTTPKDFPKIKELNSDIVIMTKNLPYISIMIMDDLCPCYGGESDFDVTLSWVKECIVDYLDHEMLSSYPIIKSLEEFYGVQASLESYIQILSAEADKVMGNYLVAPKDCFVYTQQPSKMRIGWVELKGLVNNKITRESIVVLCEIYKQGLQSTRSI